MTFDSKKYDEGTGYRLDAINPAETPWTITVRPLSFGYSIELTNETKVKRTSETERP